MRLETGSRGGVGERDVWEAADALLVSGARPTVERVRAQIGRGSPNTVAPLLDGWFRALGKRIQDPAAFQTEAPAPSVPQPVLDAAQRFWEAALDAAREEIEARLRSEREDLARIRADLDLRCTEFAIERANFEADVRAQRTLVDNYEARLRDARGAVELAQAERAALIAGQERLLSQHEQERSALGAELASARSEMLALREEITSVREGCDRDLKDGLLKLDRALTAAANASKIAADAKERLARTSAELEAAGRHAEAIERDRALLQTVFETSRNDVKAVSGDLERQRALRHSLQSAFDAERERNRELLDLLAASQRQIAEGLRAIEHLKLAARPRLPGKLRRAARIAT